MRLSSKELRNKKLNLKKELRNCEQKLQEIIRERDDKAFQRWLTSEGNIPVSVDGQAVEKLKDHRRYLLRFGELLDRQMISVLQQERTKAINVQKKELRKIEKEREKYAQQFGNLNREIASLREKDAAAAARKLASQSILRTLEKPQTHFSLRLNRLEEFLQENFVLGEELREKVLEARKKNRILLETKRIPTGSEIVRNFEVVIDPESCKVTQISWVRQDLNYLLQHFDREKLVKEIT